MVLLNKKHRAKYRGESLRDQGNRESHQLALTHHITIASQESYFLSTQAFIASLFCPLISSQPSYLTFLSLPVCTDLQVSMVGTGIKGVCHHTWLFPSVSLNTQRLCLPCDQIKGVCYHCLTFMFTLKWLAIPFHLQANLSSYKIQNISAQIKYHHTLNVFNPVTSVLKVFSQ